MNIFGHILPDQAVLGIGPLMLQYTTDPAEDSLYASRRYFCDLHLSAHTTRIESDWFRVRDNVEEQKKMQEWRIAYAKLRDKISSHIGEPTDSRKVYESDIERVCQNSFHVLEDISRELEPASSSTNIKVQRLYDNINELKTLALK